MDLKRNKAGTDTNYTYQPVKAVSDLAATLTEFCLYRTNYPRILQQGI